MKKILYLFVLLFSCSMVFGQNNLVPNTQDCSSVGASFAFNIERRWISSTSNAIYTDCTPLAGDIDGDGKTEVFAVGGSRIYLFDGQDGSSIGSVNVGTTITSTAWTGTPFVIFRDKASGKGRVFVATSGMKYYMYEISSGEGVRPITFTLLWQKTGSYSRQYVSPVISDLDGDGTPEFIVANKIVDYNGNEKATMAYAGTAIDFGYVSLPLVADLDGDMIPEIVVGTNVYKYNGTGVTLWKQCPGVTAQDGTNMAADINQDGNVDLVFHTMYQASTGFIKVWTPATSQDLGTVATNLGNGQRSIPFVGDIDGVVTNGKKYPEICFNTDARADGVWGGTLYAYSYTGSGFTQKWSMKHSDASGGTILTLYDFNNDGVMEMIYRDETLLHIFDGSGSAPISKYTITCGSETASELPIVVDASGDGSANIVVTGNAAGKSSTGEVMCFQGGASKWASCPNVWNQQLYSPLYVNTDLTIPSFVQPVNLTFTREDNSTVQFYNGGPMQAPYVSEETFLPVNLSPDVFVVDGSIQITSTSSVQITVTFGNQGMAVAAASTPIQFYKNAIATANNLGSGTLGVDLNPGETTTITKTLSGITGVTQFFVRIVDDGANFPALGAYSDCNLTNNTQSFGTLELKKTVSEQSACLNGTSFFTVELINNTGQLGLPQTFNNVIVTDSLGTGWEYLDANTNDGSIGSYDNVTRSMQWTIPVLADGDTVRMTLEAKAIVSGAIRNSAWITSHDGMPVEKDNIEAFVIVNSQAAPEAPVISPEDPHLSAEGNVVLTANVSVAGITSYQWYKDGQKIEGATSQTYTATEEGEYSVTYTDGTCFSEVSEKTTVSLANYSVIYDGNGSTDGTPPTDENSYSAGVGVTAKDKGDLVKDNAVFLGWSTPAAVGVVASAADELAAGIIAVDSIFVISGDMTLYAVWAVDANGANGGSDSVPDYGQYAVTYDGNGSTDGTVPTDPNLYNSGDNVTAQDENDLVRTEGSDAIVFAGWTPDEPVVAVLTFETAGDTTEFFVRAGGMFTITDSTTMYAVWSTDVNGDGTPDIFETGYHVTYDGNDATGGTAPVDGTNYLTGMGATVQDKGDLAKDDAVFLGWSRSALDVVTTAADELAADIIAVDSVLVIYADTELFAVWAEDANGPEGDGDSIPDYLQFTVTYDGNGSTGGTAPTDASLYSDGDNVIAKLHGDLAKTSSAIPTPIVFAGWTQRTPIIDVLTYVSAGDTALYVFIREGAEFTVSGATTLYAVWSTDENNNGTPDIFETGYHVTYDGNDATGGTAPVDGTNYLTGMGATVQGKGDLVKDDAVFLGWSKLTVNVVTTAAEELAADIISVDSVLVISGNTTLYAVWAEDANGPEGDGDSIPDYLQFTVTYDGNGSTGGTAPTDANLYSDGDNVIAKLHGDLAKTNAAIPAPIVFAGWTQRTPIIDVLTYASAGDTALYVFIREGAEFTVSGATTLYAVWSTDENGNGTPDIFETGYRVTYDGNDATSGTAPVDGTNYLTGMGATVQNKGGLAKEDAVFLGWSRSAVGVITTAAEELATDIISVDSVLVIYADTELYAVWAEDANGSNGGSDEVPDYLQFTVTYNGNSNTSGTAPTDANLYSDGDNVIAKAHGGLAKTGGADSIVFAGWTPTPISKVLTYVDAADTTTAFVREGGTFEITGNTTMYAVWSTDNNENGTPDIFEAGYHVTYNDNGATSGTAPVDGATYLTGTSFIAKDKGDLVKTGYMFLGWSISSVGVVASAADESAAAITLAGSELLISGNITLYAVWTADANGPDGVSDNVPDYLQFGVTYDANGASGSVIDGNIYSSGTTVTLKAKGDLVRTKCVFLGWNTSAVSVITTLAGEEALASSMKQPGGTFAITRDTVWHAVWAQDNDNNGIPDYNQAVITYNQGNPPVTTAVPGLPQTQAILKGSTITVSNMGVNISGYTIIGWHTSPMPVVNNSLFETVVKGTSTFYGIGDPFTTSASTITLYAVWSPDTNNDGVADYLEGALKPTQNSMGIRSGMSAQEDGGISLRSGEVPGYWNKDFDKAALNDLVYCVGCTYNAEDENLIYLNPKYSFNGVTSYTSPKRAMNFIIEYGGVLTDKCMIGGERQMPLDTIKITQAMADGGFTVDRLIDHYPLMFNSIKEDGQAVLKMYFIDPATNAHPSGDMTDWNTACSWPKVFIDESGNDTDTLVFKFNIYNKPEFESEVISQHIDTRGNMRLDQVSGTPLKYMMRSINGLSWQPASTPLTDMEQFVVGDDVSICLREMDKTIAYQIFQKEFYVSDNFDFNDPDNAYYHSVVMAEATAGYYAYIWETEVEPFPVWYSTSATKAAYDFAITYGLNHGEAAYFAIVTNATYFRTGTQVNAASISEIEERAETIYWPLLAQELADNVPVSDAPCREVKCLAFEKIVIPNVQRYVEINTITGVTANPVAGMKHYVKAHDDFTFTLSFPGGEPLKVTATGFYSQRPEEMEGTELGGGTFRYVIRRLAEPWTVTVSPDPASGFVDNEITADGRVWTYASTLYISSDKAARANIYTLSGTLLKQLNVTAGTTSAQLERGLYVVEIDGTRYKVVVK